MKGGLADTVKLVEEMEGREGGRERRAPLRFMPLRGSGLLCSHEEGTGKFVGRGLILSTH